MPLNYVMRYYHPFPEAIPLSKAGCSRVTHPSATKLNSKLFNSVRLACVRRAASVRPEPGSNSLLKVVYQRAKVLFVILFIPNANAFLYFVFFKSFLDFPFFKGISRVVTFFP